jgi:predicted negative regulator of RcsB-dependent stress response
MAKNYQKQDNDNGKEVNAIAKFSGIAFQMVVVIGVFTFAGYKIDEAYNHNVKWATAALSLAGVFISLYIVIRSVKS